MVPCTGWNSTARNQQCSSDCRHGVDLFFASHGVSSLDAPCAFIKSRCQRQSCKADKPEWPQSCQELRRKQLHSWTVSEKIQSPVISHVNTNFAVAEKMEMNSTIKIFWLFFSDAGACANLSQSMWRTLQFPPASFHVSTFWTNMPSVSLQQPKDEQSSTMPLSFRCNARKAWADQSQCMYRCRMLRPYIPLPLGNSMAISMLPKRSTAEWL